MMNYDSIISYKYLPKYNRNHEICAGITSSWHQSDPINLWDAPGSGVVSASRRRRMSCVPASRRSAGRGPRTRPASAHKCHSPRVVSATAASDLSLVWFAKPACSKHILISLLVARAILPFPDSRPAASRDTIYIYVPDAYQVTLQL